MLRNDVRTATWESELLALATLLFEVAVAFLVLASWARPRDGSAALLPLACALALPCGAAMRRLLESTTVDETVQQLALALAALAWGLGAARLTAPPGYWESELARGQLVFGSVFGGQPGVGLQPLAFWSTLVLWWRGLISSGWEPNSEDALARLRLGCAIVGVTVVLASVRDGPGSEAAVQLEEGVVVGVFLVAALLVTGLARRREMAGGAAAAPRHAPEGPRAASRLAPWILTALVSLLVLGLAGWWATLLSPALLTPAVELVGAVFGLIGSALGAFALWLAGIWPTIPFPSGSSQTGSVDPPPSWVFDLDFTLPPWLGPALMTILVVLLALGVVTLVVAMRQALMASFSGGLGALTGNLGEPQTADLTPGPTTVLARLVRVLRTLLASRSSHSAPGSAAALAAEPRPGPRSIRELYIAFGQVAARAGYPRRRAETPDELLARLGGGLPEAREPAETITALYVAARYGGRECSDEELARAASALRRLTSLAPDEPATPAASVDHSTRPGPTSGV